MKRLVICVALLLVVMSFLTGCESKGGISTPRSTEISTTIEPVITPIVSTPTHTQELNLNRMTDTPAPSLTTIPPTALQTPTPTLTNILDGRLIIMRDFSINFLEDILTGRGFNLLAEGRSIDILSWGGNGCTLIVITENGVVEIDLKGKILRTIFPFELLPDITDGNILIPEQYMIHAIDLLSPDETWISYVVGSGNVEQVGSDYELGHYEYQELETMSVDGTQGPYRLSQRGGVRKAAWSPDGLQIAYSDYDQNGLYQLFLISRDGSNRRQLTSYTKPSYIWEILWSLDGTRIAVNVNPADYQGADSTIIIDVDGRSPSQVFESIRVQWWRDNDSLIAVRTINRQLGYWSLIVLNVSTGRTSVINYGGCHRINPFGDPALVGCLTTEDEFRVYDSNTFAVEQYPNFTHDRHLVYFVLYWIAAPDSYPGEAGCGFAP